MERLTERMNDDLDGVWVKDHDYIAAAHRLADYEDTGLTPKEVRLISNVLEDVGETYNCRWEYVKNCLVGYSLHKLAQRFVSPMENMKWISVEEQLPDVNKSASNYEEVMVIATDGKRVRPMIYERACIRGKTKYRWKWTWDTIYDGNPITYWMPLPKLPKGE